MYACRRVLLLLLALAVAADDDFAWSLADEPIAYLEQRGDQCVPRRFSESYEAFYNNQDLDSVGSLISDSVKLIRPSGEIISGHGAYKENLKSLRDKGFDVLRMTELASGLSDQAAYIVSTFTLSSSHNPAVKPMKGLETYIFEKAEDGSCLLRLHMPSVPCS